MIINSAKDLRVYKVAYELAYEEDHERLRSLCAEIGRMLGSMLKNPVNFLLKA